MHYPECKVRYSEIYPGVFPRFDVIDPWDNDENGIVGPSPTWRMVRKTVQKDTPRDDERDTDLPLLLKKRDNSMLAEVPTVSFDDIGGQREAKEKMMHLALVLKNPSLYTKRGINIPRGAVLYGPPGNGKTLLARALANHCTTHFYSTSSSQLTSMWYGEQEKNIDRLFEEARKTGGIIFFDEAEDIARSRSAQNHEASKKAVAALNRNMDGFETNDRVVVIFATNRLNDLDEAVIRPERIDYWICVPNPNEEGRKEILEICVQKAEQKSGSAQFLHPLDMAAIAEKMDGFSGADISRTVKNALEEKVWIEFNGGRFEFVSTEDLLRHEMLFREERKKKESPPPPTGQYL